MKQRDLKRIYSENFTMLATYAYKRVNDESVAQDIVLDVFRKLWSEKPSISSPRDIRKYLIECTRQSVNWHNTKDFTGTEALLEYNIKEPKSHTWHLIDTAFIAHISKSLNKLPPRMKKVVKLAIAGVSTTEIAARMGHEEATIVNMQFRAQEYLKNDFLYGNVSPNYSSHKQTQSREQIIKIKNDVNEEFIKYYTKNPHKLYNISPRQYEIFVAELLKDMGYEVWLNNPTRDGGRDIIAVLKTPSNDSIVTLVECKKYSLDNPVPIDVVERFMYTIRDKDKANAGWIVTTSTFSREAQKHQHDYKWLLSLKDHKDLATLCSNYGKWKRTSEGSGLWLPDNPLG